MLHVGSRVLMLNAKSWCWMPRLDAESIKCWMLTQNVRLVSLTFRVFKNTFSDPLWARILILRVFSRIFAYFCVFLSFSEQWNQSDLSTDKFHRTYPPTIWFSRHATYICSSRRLTDIDRLQASQEPPDVVGSRRTLSMSWTSVPHRRTTASKQYTIYHEKQFTETTSAPPQVKEAGK